MRYFVLLIVFTFASSSLMAQLVQGSIGVTGTNIVTVYGKPSTTLTDEVFGNITVTLSIPDQSPDNPEVNVTNIHVPSLELDMAFPPYVLNGRVYYDFNFTDNNTGNTTTWSDAADNPIADFEFIPMMGPAPPGSNPPPAQLPTNVQLNDLTGDGGGNNFFSYWYVEILGLGDVTNYSEKFYQSAGSGPASNSGSGNSSVETLEEILPIDLVYFQARKANATDAILTWATASEVNSSHFEVYRSEDGFSSWTLLGRVEAAGNSSRVLNYKFKDVGAHNVHAETETFYYRLKMVDLDDVFEYSNVESVIFDGNSRSGDLTVYPNPSSQGLHVIFPFESIQKPEELTLFDNLGRVVYSRDLAEDTDYEYLDYSSFSISSGVYILRITNGDFLIDQKKIIVQRPQ